MSPLGSRRPRIQGTFVQPCQRLRPADSDGLNKRIYADDDLVHRVTTYIPWTIAKGTGLL